MTAKNSGSKFTHFSNLELGNSATSTGGGLTVHGPVLNPPVVIPVGTAYTVLAANSGKLHLFPAVTSNNTITLPAAVNGMEYTFMYVGVAADAEDTIFVAAAGDYLTGGVTTVDAGAGTISSTFGNGSSDLTLTVDIPSGGTKITFVSNGTVWYVSGTVASDTPAAFS